MRSLGLFLLALIISLNSSASDNKDTTATKVPDSVKHWKIKGNTSLQFNQLNLTNWSQGGESNLSGKAAAKVDLNYEKYKFSISNNVNLMFGMIGQEGMKLQKTDDKIDISTNFAYKAFKRWSYSTFVNLKTQFANGYKYPDGSTLISTFFAPAYLTLSLGMKYTSDKEFLCILSPASGKFTFVNNRELANKGAFGVRPAIIDDSSGVVLREGKNFKAEFGINVLFRLKKKIAEDITAESKLNLYNNYLDEVEENRWNIDVDWESNIQFAVNDYISTNLYLHMIYDHNVMIPQYKEIEGEEVKVGEGPRLQFKESFGIGLNVSL